MRIRKISQDVTEKYACILQDEIRWLELGHEFKLTFARDSSKRQR